MYLGTSPEFSRSCLCPPRLSTQAGRGFIGAAAAVLMKSLLVWMPIGGLSVLAGTGGFFRAGVWRTSFEPCVSVSKYKYEIKHLHRDEPTHCLRRTHFRVIWALLNASWGIYLRRGLLPLPVPSSSLHPLLPFPQEELLVYTWTYTFTYTRKIYINIFNYLLISSAKSVTNTQKYIKCVHNLEEAYPYTKR